MEPERSDIITDRYHRAQAAVHLHCESVTVPEPSGSYTIIVTWLSKDTGKRFWPDDSDLWPYAAHGPQNTLDGESNPRQSKRMFLAIRLLLKNLQNSLSLLLR